jgi:hypothetical protein
MKREKIRVVVVEDELRGSVRRLRTKEQCKRVKLRSCVRGSKIEEQHRRVEN